MIRKHRITILILGLVMVIILIFGAFVGNPVALKSDSVSRGQKYTMEDIKDYVWNNENYLKSGHRITKSESKNIMISSADLNHDNQIDTKDVYYMHKNFDGLKGDLNGDGLINEDDIKVINTAYDKVGQPGIIKAALFATYDFSGDGNLSDEKDYIKDYIKKNNISADDGSFVFVGNRDIFKVDNDLKTVSIKADLDGSGYITIADLSILEDALSNNRKYSAKLDVNGDGVLNTKDMKDLRSSFPKSRSPYDVDEDGVVNFSDLSETDKYDMLLDYNLDGYLTVSDMNSIKKEKSRIFFTDPNAFTGNAELDWWTNQTIKRAVDAKDIAYDLNGDGVVDSKDVSFYKDYKDSYNKTLEKYATPTQPKVKVPKVFYNDQQFDIEITSPVGKEKGKYANVKYIISIELYGLETPIVRTVPANGFINPQEIKTIQFTPKTYNDITISVTAIDAKGQESSTTYIEVPFKNEPQSDSL